MGWLWNTRSRSRTRPRVASAGEAARLAYLSAQTTRGRMAPAIASTVAPTMAPASTLGSAVAASGQIGWAFSATGTPADWIVETAEPAGQTERRATRWMDERTLASASAAQPARREDFGEIGALIERAEQTARDLGRSRAEMWEEALRAWLETQGEEPRPAPRPWLFDARRQRAWGEIEQTMDALRTA